MIALIKDRCVLLPDFWQQASFFFRRPHELDIDSVKPKWNDEKTAFFNDLIAAFSQTPSWNATDLENEFKALGAEKGLKVGEIMLPLRIMLVGGKFGPAVFDIAEMIGKEETIERIRIALGQLQ
ncbi:Glutamate--tRNA ligase [compost metagenome]